MPALPGNGRPGQWRRGRPAVRGNGSGRADTTSGDGRLVGRRRRVRRGPVRAGREGKGVCGELCVEGVRRAGGRYVSGCRSPQRPPCSSS